ncbi:MAG: response regulator [Candidatus Ornithomonoglobus sp.]
MYKVLIADDEQRILEGLQLIIDWKKHGFEICACAESGDEALALFEKYQPDFVLFDICMPIYTGVELARLLRERGYENDIALLTGYSETEFARQAIKYRVKYYFNKPINAEEIETALEDVRSELDKKKMLSIEYWEDFLPDEAVMKKLQTGEDINFGSLIETADRVVSCIKNRDKDGIEHYIDCAMLESMEYEESESVINIFSAYLETQILQLIPEGYTDPFEGIMDSDFTVKESVWEVKPLLMDICVKTMWIVKESDPNADTSFDSVEKYLKEHYKEEIVIKDIAKIFHMNHVYLGVAFSRKTGMSIKTYVHSLRMKEVERLIRETDMSLKNIAYEVGYNNYNNFFTWFEKIFGTTPEEYRKNLNK